MSKHKEQQKEANTVTNNSYSDLKSTEELLEYE